MHAAMRQCIRYETSNNSFAYCPPILVTGTPIQIWPQCTVHRGGAVQSFRVKLFHLRTLIVGTKKMKIGPRFDEWMSRQVHPNIPSKYMKTSQIIFTHYYGEKHLILFDPNLQKYCIFCVFKNTTLKKNVFLGTTFGDNILFFFKGCNYLAVQCPANDVYE